MLTHCDGAFEGVENFRKKLESKITSHQNEIGEDDLLATILERFMYNQIPVKT
jgi:hypothetical protein